MKQEINRYDIWGDWLLKAHEDWKRKKFIVDVDPVKKKWTVAEYIREEVRRQGHNLNDPQDGGLRVLWMQDAWQVAQWQAEQGLMPTLDTIQEIGAIIEPYKNKEGFRRVGVCVGRRKCPPADTVRDAVLNLLRNGEALSPIEWYREFELIHPFLDGNGRTGKVIMLWRAGRLSDPFFPPNDLFGDWIANP